MITNYTEFKNKLFEMGFSSGGSGDNSVMDISTQYAPNIKWHTENPDTDPWEWRMSVLDENNSIAYAKVFLKKSGYITKDWYPYFLSVRQPLSFDESYDTGLLSNESKKIYDILKSDGASPLHLLKMQWGVTKQTKSKFERALVELQMRMYITICGRMQKISAEGKPYGWYSTMLSLSDEYFREDIFSLSQSIKRESAIKKIKSQIYKLNPGADEKRVMKFITG